MRLDDLIRRYGADLRDLKHEDYAELVRSAVGAGVVAESSIARAKRLPETRFTNVVNHRVLSYWHKIDTGEGSEMDHSTLQLM